MPKAPTSAGSLKAKVRFESRTETADAYGNVEGAWAAQFTRRAEIKPLQGGEAVMASRLEGRQPALIIVRRDSQTKTITTDWRAVEIMLDATEQAYNIRSAEDMERDGRFVTILAERGVAHG